MLKFIAFILLTAGTVAALGQPLPREIVVRFAGDKRTDPVQILMVTQFLVVFLYGVIVYTMFGRRAAAKADDTKDSVTTSAVEAINVNMRRMAETLKENSISVSVIRNSLPKIAAGTTANPSLDQIMAVVRAAGVIDSVAMTAAERSMSRIGSLLDTINEARHDEDGNERDFDEIARTIDSVQQITHTVAALDRPEGVSRAVETITAVAQMIEHVREVTHDEDGDERDLDEVSADIERIAEVAESLRKLSKAA